MRYLIILFLLIPSTSFAAYNIGNMCITGTGSSTTGLISGNIGIGTTNPVGYLDVEGTVSPTLFYANGATPIGNVGIGSANPGVVLDVNGSIRATQLVVTGAPSSGGTKYVCVDGQNRVIIQSGAC